MTNISDFLDNAKEVYDGLPLLGQFAVGAGALFTTIGALTGISIAIENNKQKKDLKNLYKIFNHLDNSSSIIFTSLSDGLHKGLSQAECEQSKQTALKFFHDENTSIEYGSEKDAAENHLIYEKSITDRPTYSSFNNGISNFTSTTYRKVERYYPVMVGWQASEEHPQIAVPLYSGLKEGTAVRYDGKVFTLPNAQPSIKNQPKPS
jgi:hypothetical protein